jgi:hypothetical protein
VITETVLEMHYHRPLMELFRSVLGVGNAGAISFYKYSQQRECFVGFDQAYAKTELSEREFFNLLRNAAANSGYKLSDKFVGYFLQFKVVKEMQMRKKYTPASISRRPHYRSSLDTKKNINTGLSQHELLFNLSRKNSGAMVYYACPMLFDRSNLYDVDVDLDELRLVELASCPSSFADNDSHFIYFNDRQATPLWCSEPVEGTALSPEQFADRLVQRVAALEPADTATEILSFLLDLPGAGLDSDSAFSRERAVPRGRSIPSILPLVEDSLTVIRIEMPGIVK